MKKILLLILIFVGISFSWWNVSCTSSFPVVIDATQPTVLFDGAHVSVNTSDARFNATTCGNVFFTLSDNSTVLDYEIESAAPNACGPSATINTTYFVFGNWSNTTTIYEYVCDLGAQYTSNSVASWRAAGQVGRYHGIVRKIGTNFISTDSAGYNNLTNLSAGACVNSTGTIGEAYNATTTCRMGKLSPIALPNGTAPVSQAIWFNFVSGTTYNMISGFHASSLYGRSVNRFPAPNLTLSDGGTNIYTGLDIPAGTWTFTAGRYKSNAINGTRYDVSNSSFQTTNASATLASIGTYAGMAMGAPYSAAYWATYSVYGIMDEWIIYNGTASDERLQFWARQTSSVGGMIEYVPVCEVLISLVSPENGTITVNYSQVLTASANMTVCTNMTAMFYLDGINVENLTLAENGTANSNQDIDVGSHNWSVFLYGNGNKGSNSTSETWNFTRLPSIFLNYINISPASVGPHSNVTCTINYTNNLSAVFNISAGLAINGVINGSYNASTTSAQNNTEWIFQKNITGWNFGTNVSCWAFANDTYYQTGINYSTNATIYNEYIPILRELAISPSPYAPLDTNVTCTANFTDTDNSTFIVSSGLAINGTINTSYSVINSTYENGTNWSISNNITGWIVGTNISCWVNASDGYNATAINYTTNISVVDLTPTLRLLNISPTPVGRDANVTCEINYTDFDNATLALYAGLAINGAINDTYNMSNITYSQSEVWSFQKNITGWNFGTNVSCWAFADDGAATNTSYSENTSILNIHIPILRELTIAPLDPNMSTNITCGINFTDFDNSTFYVYSGLTINGVINDTYNSTNSSYPSGANWTFQKNITGWGRGTQITCWAYAFDGYNATTINYSAIATIPMLGHWDLSAYTNVTNGTPVNGTIGIHIYLSPDYNVSSSVILRIGNDNTSNYFTYEPYYQTNFEFLGNNKVCGNGNLCYWSSVDNWNWLRYDLRHPSSTVGTVNWGDISYFKLEFSQVSSDGVMYIDYLSIAKSNNQSWNYTGTRLMNRTWYSG